MVVGIGGVHGDGDVDAGADVDVLAGGLTNLRLPPSLSELPDQLYPTQSYTTKLLQFCNFMKSRYHPLQISNSRHRGRHHGKGNVMSGPPYDGATV